MPNTTIFRDKKRKYQHSKKGVLTDLYTGTRSSARKRGHTIPTYTKEELVQWLQLHTPFDTLYDAWVASGYNKQLKPSIDRIDNAQGYVFDNMQVITWYANVSKG